MDEHNIDLNKLKIIINNLQKTGINEITPKDLENIYFEESKKITSVEEQPMTYSQTAKKVKNQIDSLYQLTKQKGLSKEIYFVFVEKYLQIVMNKNVKKKTKIIELNKLEEEVSAYCNDLMEKENTNHNNIKR